MHHDLFFPTHYISYHSDNYRSLYASICGHPLWAKPQKNTRAFQKKIFVIFQPFETKIAKIENIISYTGVLYTVLLFDLSRQYVRETEENKCLRIDPPKFHRLLHCPNPHREWPPRRGLPSDGVSDAPVQTSTAF